MNNIIKTFPDATRQSRKNNKEIDYPDDPEFTDHCISRGLLTLVLCMCVAAVVVVSVIVAYFKWIA